MIDNYNRNINYLRLSITELCNLRCRYCMPEDGIVKKEHECMLTEDEMIQVVETAAELGIHKIRITGGEPLVKKNIISICERTANVPGIEEVCLTTNGVLLPQYAKDLRSAGVSRLNISLDTMKSEKYRYITRIGDMKDALAGIDAAFEAGFEKIKLNAVLIGGFNDDEILDFAKLTIDRPINVRFIELMPMYDNKDFNEASYIQAREVLKALPKVEKIKQDGGVAKLYKMPGAKGTIGLISPLSMHFCGSCNRIRVTADGKIKPCLHSAAEYDIKGLDKENMKKVMEEAILSKPEKHKNLSSTDTSAAGRNMNQIGG